MMPGVTSIAFPGGTAVSFGATFAPPAAPTAPPGASLLGDVGAWAGATSAVGGVPPTGGPAAAVPQGGGPAAAVREYSQAVQSGAVKAHALEIKDLLQAFGAAKAIDFQWGQGFWMSTRAIEAQGQLHAEVKRLIFGFGYVGEQTMTVPQQEEMGAALERLAAQTLATSIDFGLRCCKNDVEIMQALAGDDMMEVALRRLAARVHEQRTGDRVGAQHMLGVAPPGGSADAEPAWMVASATTHSEMEHQRRE
ncbi:unnamed protein product [Prorocentrum cordatum]|uniref:Uncharacterized protein n=1 Tax=Prorocentrum cordatum TaxID=2364126 RepID=A0ABN9S2D5_9DINO|nr:unnamed protein product [Polarella glacialis]